MTNLTKKKKKIITISIVNLVFVILFILLLLIIVKTRGLSIENMIIFFGVCGLINSFFINKKKSLWEHIKFFIPFSFLIALLYVIVYISYNLLSNNFYLDIIVSSFIGILFLLFSFIFLIGTLLGATLKEIYDRINLKIK